MQIHIPARGGVVGCIYSEQIDLTTLGSLQIVRASHVEPDAGGEWRADLSPVHGPTLGPFAQRSQALEAEVQWLNDHIAELSIPNSAEIDLCDGRGDAHDRAGGEISLRLLFVLFLLVLLLEAMGWWDMHHASETIPLPAPPPAPSTT
jgi:hypothetical protein